MRRELEPVIDAAFFTHAEYYFDGVWSNVSDEEQALIRVMAGREDGWPEKQLVATSGRSAAQVASTLQLLHGHDETVEELITKSLTQWATFASSPSLPPRPST